MRIERMQRQLGGAYQSILGIRISRITRLPPIGVSKRPVHAMALTRFAYVKNFEKNDALLPNTHIIVRIDGHSFHRFTTEHGFAKPNDIRAINLANHAATHVMKEFSDIVLAYGQSDEYSFALSKKTSLYGRRESKIASVIVSLFTSAYVMGWKQFMGDDVELRYPPSFDSRIVLYPSDGNLRDYFSWRQADCHINNLYNTAFWALVQDKTNSHTEREAQAILKDTDSAGKNELLFTNYGINYNSLPEIYRKGSVLVKKTQSISETSKTSQKEVVRERSVVVLEHGDIIGDAFWKENPTILG
ncbi:hypothetical protein SmJEL517_g04307 [Synchytrium microbalum]|uniref:tRNA(His) guanylyltransferase n=1 Tax=Synchytrium microbalum TaxID=1806994 RepID=A0A507C3R7_9FUNG|nr:uncharacterized protein SmJEL517_g04307 [Synchytrium microbalum]TPX32606.1 hypothetical protein SmJEL517_g04307 [Synchytrium microbalum]